MSSSFSLIINDKYSVASNSKFSLSILFINRENVSAIKDEQWSKSGFYILFSEKDKKGKYTSYTGKSDKNILRRLKSHDANKGFWTRAILVVRDNKDGFSPTEVSWFEWKLTNLLELNPNIDKDNIQKVDKPNGVSYFNEDENMELLQPVFDFCDFMGYKLDSTSTKKVAKENIDNFERPYWKDKISDDSLNVIDKIFSITKEELPQLALDLNYQQSYIGMKVDGKSKNFIDFHTKDKGKTQQVGFRIDKNDSFINEIILPYRITPWETFEFTLTMRDIELNEQLLREMIKSASKSLSRLTAKITDYAKPSKRVTVKDMLESGFFQPKTVIVSREKLYSGQAEILADGNIEFNGEIYDNLSLAGKACRRLVKPDISGPNGWDFWGIENKLGIIEPLTKYRDEYLKTI